MKRLVLMTLILGMMFALVIGCGDDDETPVEPTKGTGELDDFEFLTAEEAFYVSQGLGDMMWDVIGSFVDTIFTDSASIAEGKLPVATASSDTVYLTYHSASQYWYLYLQSVDTILSQGQEIEDILTLELRDSLQFLHSGAPVQWPDSSLLTGVNNGAQWTFTTLTELSSFSARQNLSVIGDIVYRGDVVTNGTRGFDFYIAGDGESGCSMDVYVTSTADDIGLNIEDVEDNEGCPTVGVFTHTGTIGIECTGDTTVSLSDSWLITQTFMGDSSLVTFENSTTRWSYTDYCGDAPISKRVADILTAIRER